MKPGTVTASVIIEKDKADKVTSFVKDPEILEALGLIEYEGFHRSEQHRGTTTPVVRAPVLVEEGDPMWGSATQMSNVHIHEYR